jgi:hypothetical protein
MRRYVLVSFLFVVLCSFPDHASTAGSIWDKVKCEVCKGTIELVDAMILANHTKEEIFDEVLWGYWKRMPQIV